MFQRELPDLRNTGSGEQVFDIGRKAGLEAGRVQESKVAARRLVTATNATTNAGLIYA